MCGMRALETPLESDEIKMNSVRPIKIKTTFLVIVHQGLYCEYFSDFLIFHYCTSPVAAAFFVIIRIVLCTYCAFVLFIFC